MRANKRFSILGLIALTLTLLVAGAAFAGSGAQEGDGGMDQGEMRPCPCQEMMARHKEMQEKHAAMAARLDELVAAMNEAEGQAKADAVAAVVNELVAQHKKMHGGMMQHPPVMHPGMGPGHGMMKGMHGAPCNCPMMQEMEMEEQEMEMEGDAESGHSEHHPEGG